MNLSRKKDLPYRGEGRLIQVKPPGSSWRGEGVLAPPYHPDNYLSIRNTYSSWDRSMTKEIEEDTYTYEVSTIIYFLNTIWEKIRSDLDSPTNDQWLEKVVKSSKSKLANRYSWEKNQNEDVLSLTCKYIERFFNNFDKEENKPLLLRLMMTSGG